MKRKPIRMCVICKNRFFQDELNRFQCKDRQIISFSGIGRSFYICNNCLKEDKKIIKYFSYLCKISKEEAKNLKRSILEVKNF